MQSLLCLPPALTYITLSSNSEAVAATGELPMAEPCSFCTWSGPTSSPELICPQFGWCSQAKGQGWTRSSHSTMSGQGLAPGNPWLHVVLRVKHKFVHAFNRSVCKFLEALLSASSSSSRQDGLECWKLLQCLLPARCLPVKHLGVVPAGRTRTVTAGTKHELGTGMLPGSFRTNNTPCVCTLVER